MTQTDKELQCEVSVPQGEHTLTGKVESLRFIVYDLGVLRNTWCSVHLTRQQIIEKSGKVVKIQEKSINFNNFLEESRSIL